MTRKFIATILLALVPMMAIAQPVGVNHWNFEGMKQACAAVEQPKVCQFTIEELETTLAQLQRAHKKAETDKEYGLGFVTHFRMKFAEEQKMVADIYPQVWKLR